MIGNSKRVGRILAMVAVGAVALAGCAATDGSDDSGGESASEPKALAYGIVGDQGDGGAPVKGGTLTFAGLAPVTNLDPTLTQPPARPVVPRWQPCTTF